MNDKERKEKKYFVFLSFSVIHCLAQPMIHNMSQYVQSASNDSNLLLACCSALEHIWWCTGKCMHDFFRRKNVGMWLMNRLRHTSVWWNCFHVKWCILISPVLLLVSIGWNQSNLQTFSRRNLVIEKSEQSVSFENIQKYSGTISGLVSYISPNYVLFDWSKNKNSWWKIKCISPKLKTSQKLRNCPI